MQFILRINSKMQKEEIRKNRQKMRNKLKISFNKKSTDSSLQKTNSASKVSPQTEFRKKHKRTSDQIRHFDDLKYLKETHVLQSFEQMFEQLEKVGEGCHSTIYKCRQIKTGRIVAAKVFNYVNTDTLSQFKDHFLITRVVFHENIIRAYYLFISEKLSKVRMVCEYLPFKNLRQFISNHKKISYQTIVEVLDGIMSGVAYLHRHGVCHRDIKPDNVLYNPKTGELKLIDFQIAKMSKYTDQPLQMWTNTGTLHYKAPEMFKGAYDEQIDIWAVGVIAYELAYGRLPFDSEYVCDTIADICEKEPNYDDENVSPFLKQFIKGCLTKDPKKRMKACEALHSPLLLSYDEGLSPIHQNKSKKSRKHSNHKHKYSRIDFACDANIENNYESVNKTPLLRKSHSSNQLLNQEQIFADDIGIRFLEN